jgi:diadenosine tetraphosphate (Ap4A) HIT family hydrolase
VVAVCEECELIASDRVVGGDEHVAIVVPKAAIGAIKIIPKHHGPLQELPAETQKRLLSTANMLSSFVFERMQVQGTNILIRDEGHAYALVLGRTEQDGIDLRWQPKRASQEELAEMNKRVSEQTWYIGKEHKEERKTAAERTMTHPKRIETRHDPSVPATSAKTRIGYQDPDPSVDTPDEIARDIQTQVKKGPKEENYMVRHLTRRR